MIYEPSNSKLAAYKISSALVFELHGLENISLP